VIRTALWALAGVVLGGVVHIAVILTLPALATEGLWQRVVALDALNKPVVLAAPDARQPNPLHMDPEFAYAICRIDLRQGPGFLRGTLPAGFWSVAVYGPSGTVLYSTTNRDGLGTNVELGIFNQVQTRLLAEQQLNVAEGLLVVEVREDDILALVRTAPPHQAVRSRYEAALNRLSCGNLAD
jgi:uncharacterized membrane protein